MIELTGREGRLTGLNATERPRLTSSMGSQVFMVVQGDTVLFFNIEIYYMVLSVEMN